VAEMKAYEMMQVAAEWSFDQKRVVFGEDTCDLIGPVFQEGGNSGDSVGIGEVATNLAVFVKELSGTTRRNGRAGAGQPVVGGEAYVSSHQLELKKTAVTLAITPEYRIKVHARDGIPERVFEKLVMPAKTFTPILVFNATLVRQGFR
jgi:hypothetical protein